MTETLDELFERDPLQLTQTDRARIIAFYTEKKGQFDTAAAEGKKVSRAKAPKEKLDLGALTGLLEGPLL